MNYQPYFKKYMLSGVLGAYMIIASITQVCGQKQYIIPVSHPEWKYDVQANRLIHSTQSNHRIYNVVPSSHIQAFSSAYIRSLSSSNQWKYDVVTDTIIHNSIPYTSDGKTLFINKSEVIPRAQKLGTGKIAKDFFIQKTNLINQHIDTKIQAYLDQKTTDTLQPKQSIPEPAPTHNLKPQSRPKLSKPKAMAQERSHHAADLDTRLDNLDKPVDFQQFAALRDEGVCAEIRKQIQVDEVRSYIHSHKRPTVNAPSTNSSRNTDKNSSKSKSTPYAEALVRGLKIQDQRTHMKAQAQADTDNDVILDIITDAAIFVNAVESGALQVQDKLRAERAKNKIDNKAATKAVLEDLNDFFALATGNAIDQPEHIPAVIEEPLELLPVEYRALTHVPETFSGSINTQKRTIPANAYTINGLYTTSTTQLSKLGALLYAEVASTLILDQSYNGIYTGTVEGEGHLIKRGSGSVSLTGQHTYVKTLLENGCLAINGTFNSAIDVQGGILKGAGWIHGDVYVYGGILRGGNSIGTLNIDGAVTLHSGERFETEINAFGASSQVHVHSIKPDTFDNAYINGTTLIIQPELDRYPTLYTYTALEVLDGGIIIGAFQDAVSILGESLPGMILIQHGERERIQIQLTAEAQALLNQAYEIYTPYYSEGTLFTNLNTLKSLNNLYNTHMHTTNSQNLKPETLWGTIYRTSDQLRNAAHTKTCSTHAYGFLLGKDFVQYKHLQLGGTLGFESNTSHFRSTHARSTANQITAGLYGSTRFKKLSLAVSSMSAYGFNHYTRNTSLKTQPTSLNGKNQTSTLALNGKLGYIQSLNIGSIMPYVGLSGFRATETGYTESGTGFHKIHILPRHLYALSKTIGLHIATRFHTLKISADLGYSHIQIVRDSGKRFKANKETRIYPTIRTYAYNGLSGLDASVSLEQAVSQYVSTSITLGLGKGRYQTHTAICGHISIEL